MPQLADLPRKNCWTLAEHAGDARPDGMQHLLGRAAWDHDEVRDDLHACVVEHLGDPEAGAGHRRNRRPQEGQPVGWGAAPYTGTAGRIENAQVAVDLLPVAACFVGGLLAIWWAEVIRRGR